MEGFRKIIRCESRRSRRTFHGLELRGEVALVLQQVLKLTGDQVRVGGGPRVQVLQVACGGRLGVKDRER